MTRKIAVIGENIFDCLKAYFSDKDVDVTLFDERSVNEYNLICADNAVSELNGKSFSVPVLNVHYSLLPAFAQKDSAEKAFTSGVRVSGITVHQLCEDNLYGKILAQYPVLIGCTTTYNEYIDELNIVAQKILPHVADAVLNDRVFDFSDLFKTRCAGGCGNCGGCSH